MINIWLIRVDIYNFTNSKYPVWGLKTKRYLKDMKEGDILVFYVNKANGGKIISIAVFKAFYNRNEETLFGINTYSNEELGWKGNTNWCYQIHYKNKRDLEQDYDNDSFIIRLGSSVINYESYIKTYPNQTLPNFMRDYMKKL